MPEKKVLRAIKISIILCAVPALTWGLSFPLNKVSKKNALLGKTQTLIVKNKAPTVTNVALKYDVGFLALQNANPQINLEHIPPGVNLNIPTQYILPNARRKGIVVNLAELRMYCFPPHSTKVYVYPVGIGTKDEPTPLINPPPPTGTII